MSVIGYDRSDLQITVGCGSLRSQDQRKRQKSKSDFVHHVLTFVKSGRPKDLTEFRAALKSGDCSEASTYKNCVYFELVDGKIAEDYFHNIKKPTTFLKVVGPDKALPPDFISDSSEISYLMDISKAAVS
nr:hypothetical protein CKG001_22100 [Bdellovibrio sp. CKG001]